MTVHALQPVMRGQKRVEDARERALDPRIHLLCKRLYTKKDGLPGISAFTRVFSTRYARQ
jgi:hypothetical protein